MNSTENQLTEINLNFPNLAMAPISLRETTTTTTKNTENEKNTRFDKEFEDQSLTLR